MTDIYLAEKESLRKVREIIGAYSEAEYAVNAVNNDIGNLKNKNLSVSHAKSDEDLGIILTKEVYHTNDPRDILLTRDLVAVYTVQKYTLDPKD